MVPTGLIQQDRYMWLWKTCWNHLGSLEEPESSELRCCSAMSPFKTGDPNYILNKRAVSLQQSDQLDPSYVSQAEQKRTHLACE